MYRCDIVIPPQFIVYLVKTYREDPLYLPRKVIQAVKEGRIVVYRDKRWKMGVNCHFRGGGQPVCIVTRHVEWIYRIRQLAEKHGAIVTHIKKDNIHIAVLTRPQLNVQLSLF